MTSLYFLTTLLDTDRKRMLPYHNSECCLNILPQNVYSLWEKKVQCNEVRLLRYKFELLVFPFSAAFYFHTPELGILLLTPLHLS